MPKFYTPASVRELALTNRKFAATANARLVAAAPAWPRR